MVLLTQARSLPLPVTVDIGGFGVMPQLLLATDGPLSPAEGDVLISSRLSLLNSSENVLFGWFMGLR